MRFAFWRRQPTAAAPMVFMKDGTVQLAEHITEDLLSQAMHLTGQEHKDLLDDMQRHADHCASCRQQHQMSINAVRLMQSTVPPHLSERNNRWNQTALSHPDSAIPRARRRQYEESTGRILRND